jgi:hypothetical protein
MPSSALAELSIGRRDASLLSLREATFGRTLEALANCPNCGTLLQIDLDAAQLYSTQPDRVELLVDEDGYRVEFRLPDSRDFDAIGAAPNVIVGREMLLERCITNGVPASILPEDVIQRVADVMADADPQGDLRLAVDCPACGQHWEQILDVGTFFWNEVQSWAMRAFREVHQIASSYGWSEGEILAMSPWRRQVYLEMLSE